MISISEISLNSEAYSKGADNRLPDLSRMYPTQTTCLPLWGKWGLQVRLILRIAGDGIIIHSLEMQDNANRNVGTLSSRPRPSPGISKMQFPITYLDHLPGTSTRILKDSTSPE